MWSELWQVCLPLIMGNITQMKTSLAQAAFETQAILRSKICYATAKEAFIILKLLCFYTCLYNCFPIFSM